MNLRAWRVRLDKYEEGTVYAAAVDADDIIASCIADATIVPKIILRLIPSNKSFFIVVCEEGLERCMQVNSEPEAFYHRSQLITQERGMRIWL